MLMRMLDYETDVSDCVVNLTMSYGAIRSDTLVVKIEVQDVNEPPIWSNNGGYSLKLSELNVSYKSIHFIKTKRIKASKCISV